MSIKRRRYRPSHKFFHGHVLDVLKTLPDETAQCVVTSPPYWGGLRNYKVEGREWGDGWVGELGMEPEVEGYVEHLVEVFREVRRVLRRDGICWLVIGDCYAGSAQGWSKGKVYGGEKQQTNKGSMSRKWMKDVGFEKPSNYISSRQANGLKPKDLCLVPFRVSLALQKDGWWVRSCVIWAKANPMPQSVKDRPTSSHEYVLMLTRSERYFYDKEASDEPVKSASIERYKYRFGGKKSEEIKRSVNPTYSSGKREVSLTRNMRDVWGINVEHNATTHYATFPRELVRKCLLAGCGAGGACSKCRTPLKASCDCKDYGISPPIVLDPFGGSGTTSYVAREMGLSSIYIDMNPEYVAMARERVEGE